MRILIVDDHALVREGLASILKGLRADATIVEAETCAAGLQAAALQPMELALVDLGLPDMPGFVALETLRERFPEMPTVVVSAREDPATVVRCLDLGAKAFVPKSAPAARVRSALEALLDGRVTLPDSVTAGAPAGSGEAPSWNLTERQREVLALLVAGLPNKLIARRLDIAESTVKIHVSAILRELRVASRTQALIAAARAGVRLPMP